MTDTAIDRLLDPSVHQPSLHEPCLTLPEDQARPTGLDAARPRAEGATQDEPLTPIDHYLRAQQELTAVERFSSRHDAELMPAQARYYRDLIPVSRPGAGQQYAFEVDLDSCTGCKACVTACHSLNGLDDDESFRSVGLLVGERPSAAAVGAAVARAGARTGGAGGAGGALLEPWQQTVTTACHHCVDPACLTGCPVDAYEKDPVTGIVKHLDDQCIGCSYCTLTCPYEVPRYNASRGIVRKCDLCSDRLADGEAPACVQACPTSAISVGVIDTADAVAAATAVSGARASATGSSTAGRLVPSAPSSALTVPTTRYRSSRPLPATAVAADHYSLRPAHAHTPLAVMLVLTQVSVGAFVADLFLQAAAGDAFTTTRPVAAAGALATGAVALAASVLHLGRPQYAWRAVIGLRHSWLSREIVAFSAFAGAAALYAAALWGSAPAPVVRGLAGAVAVTGVAGVLCSAMIYAVTGRRWWRLRVTAPKFLLSATITGPALALALAVPALLAGGSASAPAAGGGLRAATPLLVVVMVATALKLALEGSVLLHLRDETFTDLRRTAVLLTDDLRPLSAQRLVGAGLGGLVLPVALLAQWIVPSPSAPWTAVLLVAMLIATVGGELAERRTFFSAVSAPRMPGALR